VAAAGHVGLPDPSQVPAVAVVLNSADKFAETQFSGCRHYFIGNCVDEKLQLGGVFPLVRMCWRLGRRTRSVRDDGLAGLIWRV
jgi:hypothetical protein